MDVVGIVSDLFTVFHAPLAEALAAEYCGTLSSLVVRKHECNTRLRRLLKAKQQPLQDVFILSHSPPMGYASLAHYCC